MYHIDRFESERTQTSHIVTLYDLDILVLTLEGKHADKFIAEHKRASKQPAGKPYPHNKVDALYQRWTA